MDIYHSLSNENPQALDLTRIDMFTKEEGGHSSSFSAIIHERAPMRAVCTHASLVNIHHSPQQLSPATT